MRVRFEGMHSWALSISPFPEPLLDLFGSQVFDGLPEQPFMPERVAYSALAFAMWLIRWLEQDGCPRHRSLAREIVHVADMKMDAKASPSKRRGTENSDLRIFVRDHEGHWTNRKLGMRYTARTFL